MQRMMIALALLAGAAPAVADTIDFGQFGAPFTNSASPLTGFTADGVGFTMVGPSSFERIDQGNGWGGQFPVGNKLIFVSAPGQIVVYFNTAISSLTDFGIEPDKAGNYTSTATAYLLGNVVDTSVRPGLSNPGGPGLLFPSSLAAAAFDTVTFATTNDGSGFAVGSTAVAVVPGVPEPATWALLLGGFGLSGTVLRRRRPLTVAA